MRRLTLSRAEAPGGFTLLEVLVALAILGVLLSSVYSTFFFALRTMKVSREQDDVFQVARVLMERITNDVTMARFRGPYIAGHSTEAFIGRNGTSDGFARDRLDLTTASHIFFHDGRPESDMVEVGYYIDDSYPDRTFLVRREDPLPDENLRHGGTLRILADNVVGLNFRYRERGPQPFERVRGQEWEEPEWHDTWDASKVTPEQCLPELVEVTLTLRDQDGRNRTFTTIVLLHPY